MTQLCHILKIMNFVITVQKKVRYNTFYMIKMLRGEGVFYE